MKSKTVRRLIPVLFLISLILVFPAATLARSFDTVIAFGDSLSDHYGLQSYIGVYDPVSNPNGALEAWTNGDVWVEYLADLLNADLDNNAIAGAMTKGHENDDIQAMSDAGTLPQLGLIGQVNKFVAENTTFNPGDTLFTIWIGGNDLLKYGRGESEAASANELITDAIDNIVNSMSALVAEGAVQFLVINLPDLGKSPAYNTRTPVEIAGVTALSTAFNDALNTGINNFKSVFPSVTVYQFDVFTYLNEVIRDKKFKNSTGTYMVLDASGNYTGATNEPAEDYLFWDTIHPTTKAHQLVAVEVAEDLFDVDDDDDDSCFIVTASTHHANPSLLAAVSGFCLLLGFAGWVIKKDSSR